MIQAGDILTCSWGYDQTNVDWYRVTARKGKRVYLEPLEGHTTETGFMCGRSVPGDKATAPVFYRKAISGYSGGAQECVRITSYSWAYPWDGKPEACSWYA